MIRHDKTSRVLSRNAKIRSQVFHSRFLKGKSGLFLLVVMLLPLATGAIIPAWAQDPVDLNVRKELQELDRLLAIAREVLASYDNADARHLLQKAEMLRKEAESKLRHTPPRRQDLEAALAFIKQAIRLVEQAIALALKAPLSRLVDTLERLMSRAEQTVVGSGNREAERLLREAKKIRTEAQRALRQGGYFKAAQLFQLAISLTEQALKLVEGRRPAPVPSLENIRDRERERFDNLRERAREAVEGRKNPAALRVLQQALKQREAAEEAFRRGEMAIAQQLYNGAIRLLLRAIDLALAEQRGRENLKQQAALLNDLIQAAEHDLEEGADARAAMLLERARILVREAEAAIERNQPQEVRWRLELARNFIDRAMRRAGRSPANLPSFEQRCDEALRELAQDLAEVGAKAREANKTEAIQLVELAARAHQAAENACRQGQQSHNFRHFQAAFQLIRTAHYFLLRAETLLRDSSQADSPAREVVMQRLAQLDAALNEMRQDVGGSELSQIMLEQATDLRERARVALERGHLHVAAETIAVAFDLIRESIRLSAPNQNQPQ